MIELVKQRARYLLENETQQQRQRGACFRFVAAAAILALILEIGELIGHLLMR